MARLDEVADAWEAAWSGRDTDAFADVCAPDLHYEDPFTQPPLRGTDALGTHAQRLWSAFPDVTVECSGERLWSGHIAALPVRIAGTNMASLEGLPPSHRYVAVHAVCWCELDPPRERLWRVRTFLDAYAAAIALGVLPPRGSVRERMLLMLQGYGLRVGGAGPRLGR